MRSGAEHLRLTIVGSELLLHLAYIVRFLSTLPRSVFGIRNTLIATAVAFVIYGIVAGVVAMIVWNGIIAILYAIQNVKHLRARSRATLTPHDEHFRRLLFGSLDEVDFAVLWSLGQEGTMTRQQLTYQGVPADSVWLVLDGVVDVRRDGQLVNKLGVGSLVGEMSYVSGHPEVADTYPQGRVLLRRWQPSALRMLAEVNPVASRALFEAMSKDLERKLNWQLRSAAPVAGTGRNL